LKRFGEFIVKRRWWILAIWLIAAAAIIGLSPKISSIQSNDQSGFLPKNYESIKAMDAAKNISQYSKNPTDIIVFKNSANGVLSDTDLAKINQAILALNAQKLNRVVGIVSGPEQLSPNHKIMLAQVIYSGNQEDKETMNAVKALRDGLNKQLVGTQISAATTGGESVSYDTQGAANRALKIVSVGTLLIVLILPALIFRSPLAGLLPIIVIGLIYTVSSSLIALAGTIFDFKVDQQLSIMFTVVLYGIGTDYILFLLFRYRERLRSGDHTKGAVAYSLGRAGEAIFSAALVVLTSFAALFFAKFGIFSSFAPGLVICVAVMMLAAMTLVPAVVAIVGEKIFWPSKAWMEKPAVPTVSKKIGGIIARKPAIAVAIVLIFLLVLTSFMFGKKSDFSSFSQPPKGTQSANAYNDLIGAFPSGILSPTEIYITGDKQLSQTDLIPLQKSLATTKGVATVLPAKISQDGKTAVIAVVLKDNPYSAAALENVEGPIRSVAHSANINGTNIYVGGFTSLIVDLKDVTNRDLKVLFPIAAAFIFVILAVLLRSLVAPILLLLCVGLGYYATIGTTNLIFVNIGGDAGLISFIPLFIYIFVVAIGTDYNILTMTRLREEVREGNNPRKSADLTVEHSSATVASAGLILAATFGSLLLAKISFLSQMGTSVSVGVLLAAFVIAPFLIPGISALVGYRIWWPGHKPAKENSDK
jgi:RND superfamily putative drug exporter